MRTLLLIIAVVVGYLIIKQLIKSKHKPTRPASIDMQMVKCEHCGVHIPESEAVSSKGQFFCSEEHRRLHQQ